MLPQKGKVIIFNIPPLGANTQSNYLIHQHNNNDLYILTEIQTNKVLYVWANDIFNTGWEYINY